jgi:hypothetical protein
MDRDQMKATLRTFGGLAPWRVITDAELDAILAGILKIAKTRKPDGADVLNLLEENVEDVGTYKKKGEDMSSVNAMLTQLLNVRPVGTAQKPKQK